MYEPQYLILHEVHLLEKDTKSNMADEKGNVDISQRKQRRQEWWKKKRRQKDQSSETNNEQPRKKRVKLQQVQENEEEPDTKTAESSRCILFIGNLSYECTEDDIRNHFDFDGGVTDIRMLTSKSTGKPKGCAFLEFKNKIIQAKALKLHHSTLCGRQINVEVTCGGGGRGEQRMTKLRSKIDKMKDKRKKAKLKKKQLRQAATGES